MLASILSLSLALVRLHSADQEFLRAAIRTEASVVTLSMLTLRKSSEPKVHSLANTIIAHHGVIVRRLNDLLGHSDFDVPAAGYDHDALHLESLAGMRDEEFTKTALREMAGLLDARARLFDAASRRHGNLEVRSLARDAMPAVRQDADRVRAASLQ